MWRQKLDSFSVLMLWLLFFVSRCQPFASALKRLLARHKHLKAKSWRDKWRLILKQRIGTLLKAESPMDFSPFIEMGHEIERGESALLKSMNLGDFTLSNFKSTVVGDNIVVTFIMTVAQTIDGKQLPPKPAYRLSVWKKERAASSGISHANLASIP